MQVRAPVVLSYPFSLKCWSRKILGIRRVMDKTYNLFQDRKLQENKVIKLN